MTTDDIMALADALENPTIQAGALRHTIAAELRRLHAENETLRYEVDAIAAIKEERDALQASQVAARKLLEAYAQVKASDEALMEQALDRLDTARINEADPLVRQHYDETIAALQDRLQ